MSRARWLAFSGLLALCATPLALHAQEAWTVEFFEPPPGEVLEVGGLGFLSDGRMLVSTRRGQVWLVEGALGEDPKAARYTLFAEGLCEGLGLNVVDDVIYIVQRGELSRLYDDDGDQRCDRIETVCASWGLSGNYHEFAYGLPRDEQGNFYVSLNLGFFSPQWWHGKSAVPWRGWVVRVHPDGSFEPWACGLRSPCGIGFDAEQRLLVTDNQGDWMAASPIFHIRQDRFYGHPASLEWTPEYQASHTGASDTLPAPRATQRDPAAVWLPYEWSRSPGNLVPDQTAGRFGPFEKQLFLAELTNGALFRVQLEELQGTTQGVVLPFLKNVGSACRVLFAPDGSLIVGLTNRGWGGEAPASGLARVRYSGELPFEIDTVRLVPQGFAISFTRPLAPDCSIEASALHLRQYEYDYWWEYGSPEVREATRQLEHVELSADRRSARLYFDELLPGMVARCELPPLFARDAAGQRQELRTREFAYTINQLADGPPRPVPVAKIAPPPPARESSESGWLRLTFGDATDGWTFEGWELVDAQLDPEHPERLRTKKGVGALCNTASKSPTDYASKQLFGDGLLTLSFMLPRGGRSGVRLMGRYEIELVDAGEPGDALLCGSLPKSAHFAGAAPAHDAWRGAGELHDLEVQFRAPRFDAAGNKLENARFERIELDDVLLHEQVELVEPSPEGQSGELAAGPLVLIGTRGPCSFGNVRFRPEGQADPRSPASEPLVLFDAESEIGHELEGWTTQGSANWSIDDEGLLVGEGGRGFLLVPRFDYRDFEVRARLKISEGGNSGLVLRANQDGAQAEPLGYEAEVNASFPDVNKTGSLLGFAAVKTHLIAPDTWFDYRIRCQDEQTGTRLTLAINGVVVNEFLDLERRFTAGSLAIEQHHEGSRVEFAHLELTEL